MRVLNGFDPFLIHKTLNLNLFLLALPLTLKLLLFALKIFLNRFSELALNESNRLMCLSFMYIVHGIQLYASQNIKLAQKVDTQQNNVTQVFLGVMQCSLWQSIKSSNDRRNAFHSQALFPFFCECTFPWCWLPVYVIRSYARTYSKFVSLSLSSSSSPLAAAAAEAAAWYLKEDNDYHIIFCSLLVL